MKANRLLAAGVFWQLPFMAICLAASCTKDPAILANSKWFRKTPYTYTDPISKETKEMSFIFQLNFSEDASSAEVISCVSGYDFYYYGVSFPSYDVIWDRHQSFCLMDQDMGSAPIYTGSISGDTMILKDQYSEFELKRL